MKRVIEICLEECAYFSIAEAHHIYQQLGTDINCDQKIREAVLKFKFSFKYQK